MKEETKIIIDNLFAIFPLLCAGIMSTIFSLYATTFESSEIGYIVSGGFACIIVLLGLNSSVIITLTKVLKK